MKSAKEGMMDELTMLPVLFHSSTTHKQIKQYDKCLQLKRLKYVLKPLTRPLEKYVEVLLLMLEYIKSKLNFYINWCASVKPKIL